MKKIPTSKFLNLYHACHNLHYQMTLLSCQIAYLVNPKNTIIKKLHGVPNILKELLPVLQQNHRKK